SATRNRIRAKLYGQRLVCRRGTCCGSHRSLDINKSTSGGTILVAILRDCGFRPKIAKGKAVAMDSDRGSSHRSGSAFGLAPHPAELASDNRIQAAHQRWDTKNFNGDRWQSYLFHRSKADGTCALPGFHGRW